MSSCRGGDEVLLRIELREDPLLRAIRFADEDGEDGPRTEVRELRLLIDKFSELRPAKGGIDEEFFLALVSASEFTTAVRMGARMLSFSASTKRALCSKLIQKGIDREIATDAAEYLAEKGYISETRDAKIEAQNQVRKLRGRNRVLAALRDKGFSEDAMEAANAYLETVDFVELCVSLIEKRYRDLLCDGESRRKLAAMLMRFGYTMREIREAMEIVHAK